MSKVYVANFGRENYAWPRCRDGATIATMNDEDTHPLWLANEKEAYIALCQEKRLTAGGKPVPKQTASRWFNLMTELSGSSGDIWIHRDGEALWWTTSSEAPAVIDEAARVVPYQDLRVFECHKPCQPWSNKNELGEPLVWSQLHPKAKQFLSTEQTFQIIQNKENAEYAKALIAGADLTPWHNRLAWRLVENPSQGLVPGFRYARADVAILIAYPEGKHTGGDFATGYFRWQDQYFIFCNIGEAGRTGHNYPNERVGSNFLWFGKTASSLQHESIQEMISGKFPVHFFWREEERDRFEYAGEVVAKSVVDSTPVQVEWRLASGAPAQAAAELDYSFSSKPAQSAKRGWRRGPPPSQGRKVFVYEAGQAYVYLMRLVGNAHDIIPELKPGLALAKVGRSKDPVRRAAELNSGFPSGASVGWEVQALRPCADEEEAHDLETSILIKLRDEGYWYDKEFSLVPETMLEAVLHLDA